MDTVFCILLFLLKVIHAIVYPVYLYNARGKRKVVPPIKNDLLNISATDLAEKIRKKKITSEEVCKAYIQRIQEVNPIINAVVQDRFEEAIQDARKADQYLIKCTLNDIELKVTKPLLGVPVTIKESCAVKGMALTSGMLDRADCKSEADGEAVSRLKTAGAVILLVSNTPELCLFLESYNYVTGATNNPYDTTCTSGGSSGGEGALLGAGASVIGLGSDIAGSIRIPSSFNGIFGHKPTARIASIAGHYPACPDKAFADFLVIGPMTRYAKDLRLMMNIITEPHYKLKLRFNDQVALNSIKVFFKEDIDNCLLPTTQEEIKLAVVKAARHLQTCGATLETHKFPEWKDSLQVCVKVLYSTLDVPNPLKGMSTIPELEFLKSLFGYSKFSPNILYGSPVQNRIFDLLVADHSMEAKKWKHNFIDKLGTNGILLYPTMHSSATKHHEGYFTLPSTAYLATANVLGLPATNVPCGFDKKGMPIGIQVIAAPYQDKLCLTVAEELERYFGGWRPPQ